MRTRHHPDYAALVQREKAAGRLDRGGKTPFLVQIPVMFRRAYCRFNGYTVKKHKVQEGRVWAWDCSLLT